MPMATVQVFQVAYCQQFSPCHAAEVQAMCQSFVDSVKACNPEMLGKLKIHTLLHLSDSMMDFGPTAAFSAERYINKRTL